MKLKGSSVKKTITMFGIPNCDTVKKARQWLDQHAIDYAFHDYKKAGIAASVLHAWSAELGWEVLLNKAGTTFRALPEDKKLDIDADKAISLMVANPSLIRRPVLDLGDKRVTGFKPDQYSALFADLKG